MKRINFNNIHIENFLSIGSVPLVLDFNQGLNVITGMNLDKEDSENGVGKSSVADALFFVLFGDTIRELKKEQIVNNINKKNCKVEIDFTVSESGSSTEYKIVRGIRPTKLKLYKGDEDITCSSIPKTTLQIAKIISSTPEVFRNSIIMSVNNTLPFMAQKKVEKRKFVEGVLSVGIFGEMLLVARQNHNDLKRNLDIENVKTSDVENQLDIYKNQQEKRIKQREERIDVLKERRTNNNAEMQKLKRTLKIDTEGTIKTNNENVEILKKKEASCSTQIRNAIKKIASTEANINNNEKDLRDLKALKDVCYTCKRPFKTDDITELNNKKKNIELKIKDKTSEIKEINKKLKELEDLKKKVKAGIEKFKTMIHKNELLAKENENVKSRVEQLQEYNKQIKIDIKNLKTEDDEFDTLISDSQARYDVLEAQLKKLKNDIVTMEAVKFVVSEEGVKSFIVKKILKILNSKLTYYLKKLDANCICEFNEYFEETIMNDKGQECSYHNFSGGERRRIDLAMLFTFMDIRRLQGDVSINVSFYDEILDTSVDDKGIQLFLDILHTRVDKFKEAIYLISHKKAAVKKATNEIIFLEKKNGFTYRADSSKLLEKE